MKKVTILVPCYNEEKSLPIFYTEVRKLIDTEGGYNWEILFVNDGSKDNTFPILKAFRAADPQVSYLNLSRNFGKERAMLAGFDYAQGDCVIIMDADLQDPPSLIPQMLRYWETGYKDVYAKRNDRGRESWLRKQFSLLFYKILSHTTRFDILQNVGDFRLLDRQCVESLKKIRETERYTKGLYCWIGYEKKEIVFDRSDRIAGSSNWNFWSLFDLAIEGMNITENDINQLRMFASQEVAMPEKTFMRLFKLIVQGLFIVTLYDLGDLYNSTAWNNLKNLEYISECLSEFKRFDEITSISTDL